MTEDAHSGGVRITNKDIYDLLLGVNTRVGSVEQTIRDLVRPSLDRHDERIHALEREKADMAALVKTDGRLEKVEMRVYAILSGLLAAIGAAKGLGIL